MLGHYILIHLPHFQLRLPCLRAKHHYVPVESADALKAHYEVDEGVPAAEDGAPAASEGLETCDCAFEAGWPDCK
jgi:hypothetical protein